MLASVLIQYSVKSLNKVFDYLMENLFLVFLFPNYAFYFLEIVITNIIIWLSLFHYKTSDAIKRLNIIVYLLMNYFLMLLLSVVDSNKLDIFSSSLFNFKLDINSYKFLILNLHKSSIFFLFI